MFNFVFLQTCRNIRNEEVKGRGSTLLSRATFIYRSYSGRLLTSPLYLHTLRLWRHTGGTLKLNKGAQSRVDFSLREKSFLVYRSRAEHLDSVITYLHTITHCFGIQMRTSVSDELLGRRRLPLRKSVMNRFFYWTALISLPICGVWFITLNKTFCVKK